MQNDKKILNAMLLMLSKKEKITITKIANLTNLNRASIYYRINNIKLSNNKGVVLL